MFPLNITYKKKLKFKTTGDLNLKLIDHAKNSLEEMEPNHIYLEGLLLKYRNNFFDWDRMNFELMQATNSGLVELNQTEDNYTRLTYNFVITKAFVGGVIGLLTFSIIAFYWHEDIWYFGFLGFIGWLIAFFRHSINFFKLIDEMNEILEIEENKTHYNNGQNA